MKITNPIFQELIKLRLIKKKDLIKLSNKTRDKKTSVYQDRISKVIFLGQYKTGNNYYKAVKYEDNYTTLVKNNRFSTVKIQKKNVKLKLIEDDKRRFFQFKSLLNNKKVLDFGCGWGGFLKLIDKAKLLTGVELRDECIFFIRKNIKKILIKNNLNNIKDKYDVITMFHVLEHVPYQVKILKELKSKLSKNGKIIIEVPSAQDFLLSFDDLKDFKKFTFWSEHLVLHTENSLRKILKTSGFKKIKIEYYQRYNFNNHLGWFIKKKPGGHDFYKDIFDDKINKNYIDFLKRIKKTDTLIAIASN
jgi:2-polyprenyl-3-methyl-5-hydroxy-6-metoxy-1,4-benzoquinol methylase